MNFNVEQAEYHRNGVGGEGFFTGIATCEVEGVTHRMLVTFFPEHTADGETCPAGKDGEGEYHNGRVAVLDVDLIPEHGVAFGINSWRGDNFYAVADAIVATVQERWEK